MPTLSNIPIPSQPTGSSASLKKDPPFWLWGACVAFFAIAIQLIFVFQYGTIEGPLLILALGTLLGAVAGQVGGKLGGAVMALFLALLVGAATPLCLIVALYFFGGMY